MQAGSGDAQTIKTELLKLKKEAEEEVAKQHDGLVRHNRLRVVWGGAAATLAGLAGGFALLELPPGVVAAVAFLSLAVTALEKTFNPTESRARKARLEADFKHLAWQAEFALSDARPD